MLAPCASYKPGFHASRILILLLWRGTHTRQNQAKPHTSKSGPVVTLQMLFCRSHRSASQQALAETPCVPLRLCICICRHEVHLCHTPVLELWVQSYARRHALHLGLILSARRHEVHLCHTPTLELWVQTYARRYALILSAQMHEVHLCHTPALELWVQSSARRHALHLYHTLALEL